MFLLPLFHHFLNCFCVLIFRCNSKGAVAAASGHVRRRSDDVRLSMVATRGGSRQFVHLRLQSSWRTLGAM